MKLITLFVIIVYAVPISHMVQARDPTLPNSAQAEIDVGKQKRIIRAHRRATGWSLEKMKKQNEERERTAEHRRTTPLYQVKDNLTAVRKQIAVLRVEEDRLQERIIEMEQEIIAAASTKFKSHIPQQDSQTQVPSGQRDWSYDPNY